MKLSAWTVASLLTAATLAPTLVSARTTLPSQTVAEKTAKVDEAKDAVVTASKTTAAKTKDGVSRPARS